MKISWRDRDALISIGGMQDSFEIVGGMRDLNDKWPCHNLTRRGIGTKILKVAGWRDEAKTSGGMRDLKSLFGPSAYLGSNLRENDAVF